MAKLSLICSVALFVFASASTPPVYANPPGENELPTGAQITAGSGSVSQTANTLNVSQQSGKLITNWQTFNVGSKATVNFQQPNASSIALNRVLTEGASQIHGNLNANGQVFLINPSGITFAPGARVDVGGLVSSTLNISDDDFLNGNMVFENNSNAGSIVNQGHLSSANGGYVALISPRVINEGTITTPGGTTALAAGTKVSLDFAGDQLVNLTVDQGAIDALIANKGLIQAGNGTVMMSAKAADHLTRSVVNNSGVIEAQGVVEQGGRILLTADGGDVSIANTLDVSSDAAQGGDVIIIGDEITLAGNTTINARGATGGGDVLVGGDWQGSGDLHQATTVTMEEGASINASATNNGDGGKIVLWSDIKNKDSVTSVAGTLTARGGANGGDGGAIETSGAHIDTANVAVNAGAEKGTGGLWLIDPYSYSIEAAEAVNISNTLNTGTSVTVTTTVDNASQGSNGIDAANGGTLRVLSAITKTSGGDATLTLKSDRNMEIEDSITSTDGKLNLVLWANQDGAGQGSVAFESDTSGVTHDIDITTNGGHLWIGGGSGSTTWNGITVGDGAAHAIAAGSFTSGIQFFNQTTNITTAGGSIYMAGTTDFSSSRDIRFGINNATTIDAGAGSIELVGDNISFANDSTLETTGELIISPFGTSFVDGSNAATAFTWDGTRVGSNLDGAASLNGLIINNVDSLGGLTLGKDGTISEIIIKADTDIAGDVSVYAGTIDVLGDLTAAGDILLDADTGSQLGYNGIGVTIGDATVSTTAASNGSITIEGRGGNVGASAQQGVFLNTNSQITAGGSGDVTITGFGGLRTGSNHHGILLQNNNGITAGGDIVLSGNGGGLVGGSGNHDGVRLEDGKIGSDSSGSVTINGTTNGLGSAVQDILIFGAGSEIRTGAGNDILLRGDSFGLSDNASGTQSTTIGNSTSTIGTLTFESVSDSFVDGFTLPELTLENLGGLTLGKDGNTSEIIIDADTNVTGGVSVYAGTIDVLGDLTAAGDILLDADTGIQLAYNGIGVKIENATVSTTAASNGSITIVGRGGNQNGQQQGVTLAANSQLTAGGTGDVTITGFGGDEILDGNHHGILLLDNNGITAGGDIVLTGNGGGSIGGGGNNDGVRLNGGKIGSDSSGSVTINGTTNADGPAAQDILIFGEGSEIRTGAGNDILLRGDSFGLGDNGPGPTPAARTTTIGNSTSTIGTLTFESVSDSFVDTGFILPMLTLENLGNLVVGKPTNAASVDIKPTLDVSGLVDVFGGDIQTFENWNVGGAVSLNGDEITTSGVWNVGGAVSVIGDGETLAVDGQINTTGDNVLLKNTGDIEVVTNASMTTLGGDITFWSDSDNNGDGYIHLEDNVTLNSATAGGTSGGGNITLAGGLDTNADGRPDGFAASQFGSGVTLGLTGANTTTMLSGGGDVVVRGKGLDDSDAAVHNYGVEALGLLTVDSGTGTISITGESADNTAVFFSQGKTSGTALDLKSAATTGDAIAITGTATGSIGVGVSFTHATSEKSLQATGGGDITITGTGVGSDYGIDMRATDVLASSGDITFIGTGERIYLLGSTIGEKTGTDVVNSTSDIVLRSSKDVVLTESTTLQTGGGDITLWSDSNANNDGYINVAKSTVLDSRTAADRTAGTHTSGGGNITLSGGSDLTTGYAQGNADDGVNVGTGGKLYSGGGDILVRGKSNAGGSSDHGVVMLNGTELLSGVGSISVTGQSDSGNGIRLSNTSNGTITLSSSKASGDAIVIDAQSSGTYGLYFNQSSTKKELSATGGGDIRITGDTTAAGSFGIYASYTQLLAASGTITLDAGANGLGGGGGSSFSDLVFGAEAGSSVTASSSDVNIISDQFSTTNNFEQFVDTTGHLTIAPSSTAFDSGAHGTEFGLQGTIVSNIFTGSDDVETFRIRNYNMLGGLTVGKQDNTSDIAINSTQTINGDINLLGGDITLNAALTAAGSNTISLTSSGNVTDSVSGFVVADNLALLGGNVTLDHANNNVTTLAASGVGNVSFSDRNALTIGVVDANSGIAATGAIDISTLAGNLETTESVNGSSVTLNAGKNTAAGTATGGNLLFSGASSVTASSGNAQLYSGSVAGSTGLTDLVGSGSGNFRYNSDESATNYSAALGASGNYAIYREQPSVTVIANNETVTYGTAPTLVSSLGGAQNGDTIEQSTSTAASIAVGGSTSSSGNYTAGNHSLTASGAVDQFGYAISGYTNGTLTVNQKTIATTLSANNKEYDGTTTATVGTMGNGLLVGDDASVNGAGVFADKNAGTGKLINVTGLNISGADSSNYALDSTTGTSSADITQKDLTVSSIAANDKTYDGNATATTNFASAVYTGLVGGDDLALSSVTGIFDNKNVGTGKTVALSSSYSGVDVNNYNITDQATALADIAQRGLTITGITAGNKAYDGNATATTNFASAVYTGLVGGDDLALSSVTGVFDNKNAGTGKTVNLSSNYSGADFANYNITNQNTAIADITQRNLTITGITAGNKIYDGNTNATTNFASAVYSGLISGDDLALSSVTGVFDNKNVGTAKAVTLSSNYSGADTGNYNITNQAATMADITQRNLTVSSITANDKAYDGNTTATTNFANAVYTGLVNGDDLALSSVTGVFNNKNAGTGKTVTLSSNYNGVDVGNYNITDQATTLAGIAQRGLTVSGITAGNKAYDGNTNATTNFASAVYTGLIGGDTVALSSVTGVFDNKNAGTGKTVNLNSSYGGADVSNYNITNQNTAIADITQRNLTITGITAGNKIYDGNTNATTNFASAVYSGLISGDDLALSSVTGVFDNKNVGAAKAVTLSSNYSGADTGNYNITNQAATMADITQRNLTVSSITANDKAYDGNTTATTNFANAVYTGLVNGDDLALSSVAGVFDNKNVGAGKTVTLSSSYSGVDVGNYNIADQATTLAGIAQRGLTVSGITAGNKAYDGNTSATTNFASAVYTGLIGGDAVALSSVTGVFDNKNAGTGKTVNLSSSYGGADVSNYNITNQNTAIADITQKNLTVSGIAANDKAYDGNTNATTEFSNVMYSGLIGEDVVTLSSVTGVFDNKNVGTAKAVTLSSNYSGADTGNYNIIDQVSTQANIAAKTLTIDLAGEGNKTYDGATIIDLAGVTPTLDGFIAGDDITVDTGNVVGYVDKNVGTNKFVQYTGFGITGGDAGNYYLPLNAAESSASVIARDVAVSGITANDKIYDGNTLAIADFSAAVFTNIIGGDDLTLSSVTGTFDNKNVGVGKAVNLNSHYSGADTGNYNITNQAATMADITQRNLTVSSITANDKAYDGNTTATTNFASAVYAGLVSGDDVALSSVTGVFDSKNVGTGKTVTLSSNYSGVDISNYNITDQATTLAGIAQRGLTVSGITAGNKAYDGNTSATTNFASAVYTGLIGGDAVALSSVTGVFDNKNAGTGKTVNLSSSYGGADVSNYNITNQNTAIADITRRNITVSGVTVVDKTYDGNTAAITNLAGVVYSGLISDDVVTLSSVTGTFDNKSVGVGKTVNLNSHYSGADLANYSITDQLLATASVSQRTLSISANSDVKFYNGIAYSGGNGATYSGLVGGETDSVLGGTLRYGGSAQGAIDVGGYAITLAGLTSDNYAITFVNGALEIVASTDNQSDSGIQTKFIIEPGLIDREAGKNDNFMLISENEINLSCTTVEFCSSIDTGLCVVSKDAECNE